PRYLDRVRGACLLVGGRAPRLDNRDGVRYELFRGRPAPAQLYRGNRRDLHPCGIGASDRLITSIQNLGATQLTCTPSYAIYLAEYVRNKFHVEPSTLGIRRIQVGAEPGGGVPAVRQSIEEDWGAFVTEGLGN